MTVADDLERVADLLGQGWCQGKGHTGEWYAPNACCVSYAIALTVPYTEIGWVRERNAAERAICEAAGLPTEHIEVNTLWDLNDGPEMTQERMVALVRKAAETERAKEAV